MKVKLFPGNYIRLSRLIKAVFIFLILIACTINAQEFGGRLNVTVSNNKPELNEPVKFHIECTSFEEREGPLIYLNFYEEGIKIVDNEKTIPLKLKKGETVTKEVTVIFTERKIYHPIVRFALSKYTDNPIGKILTVAVKGAFDLDVRNVNLQTKINLLQGIQKDSSLTDQEKKKRAREDFTSPAFDAFRYPENTASLTPQEKDSVDYYKKKNDELYEQLKKEYDSLRTVILKEESGPKSFFKSSNN